MAKLPWLDYTGQTTAELMACKETHRIDSILCAFEYGIQAKGEAITGEEGLVLAVMALQREVNNGGYHQFFTNSSGRFAPVIVDCLRRIECSATEKITAAAIEAGAGRLDVLDACDRQFYQFDEITPNLFRFVEDNQPQIQLIKAVLPPPPKLKEISAASKLFITLMVLKVSTVDIEEARGITRRIAGERGMAATDEDIEAAASLLAFNGAVKAGDLEACERTAPAAFQLMHDDTWHCILHRKWVEYAISVSRWGTADAAMLTYLKHITTCDRATLGTQNRILYWAVVLQKNLGMLPKSEEFFRASFPDEDLSKPLPTQRFKPKDPNK